MLDSQTVHSTFGKGMGMFTKRFGGRAAARLGLPLALVAGLTGGLGWTATVHAQASVDTLTAAAPAAPQHDPANGAHFSSLTHFDWRDGEAIYTHICQGCHMPDAKGASGAGRYPALAGNTRLASRVYPAFMVTNGNRAMPGFAEVMDDAQIAAVVNYVRTHFGNHYTDVLSAAEVHQLRHR